MSVLPERIPLACPKCGAGCGTIPRMEVATEIQTVRCDARYPDDMHWWVVKATPGRTVRGAYAIHTLEWTPVDGCACGHHAVNQPCHVHGCECRRPAMPRPLHRVARRGT